MPLNNKKILIVVAGELASNYVTAIYPLNFLQKTYDFTFDIFEIENLMRRHIDLDQYALVIFVRIIVEEAYRIVYALRDKKIPLLYIIDDDFETLTNVHIRRLNPSKTIPTFCSLATSVIVTTEPLFEKYKKYAKRIDIVGIYIDIDLFNSFNVLKSYTNEKLVIGYASGEHNYPNLNLVLPALQLILIKYPHITFELFFSRQLKELKKFGNVKYLQRVSPITSYYGFVASRDWDIGIAPLEGTIFNRSKSDLKYREYGALKIPGIYSNTVPYKNITDDGIICNDDGWESALESLIVNPTKRLEISKRALYRVSKMCAKESIFDTYVDIFKYCLNV